MKRWVGVLFVALFLASFAHADTLTLVSAPYGVNGPYSLSLNGSNTPTPMICYSENNHIAFGQTWSVQAYTIDTIGALAGQLFGGTTAADTIFKYNLLGYLADQLFANPGNGDLQNAIWAVLGTGGVQNSKYADAVAYLKAHPEYKTSNLFYIPIGNYSNNPLGIPQPFIVQAPEPGSMLLLGAGLLGLARFRRRKLAA